MATNRFPYHYQDCSDTCGPTCLMMLLHSRKVSMDGLFQDDLLQEIQSSCMAQTAKPGCGYFASPPDGFAQALNARFTTNNIPAPIYETFYDDPEAGQQRDFAAEIRNCLGTTDPKPPVAALVGSGGHWVLVYDWYADSEGNHYRLRWPAMRGSECVIKEKHTKKCTTCKGGEDMVKTEDQLLDCLLPVADAQFPHAPRTGFWTGKTVLIVPRLPGFAMTMANNGSAEDAELMSEHPVPPPAPPPNPDHRKPMTADAAVAFVRTQFPRLAAAFSEHAARFVDATIPRPLRVSRLDRPADSYFLVPVHAKGGGAFLLAAVHERTGKLLEFSAATVDDEDGELSEPLWPGGIPGEEKLAEINCADRRTDAKAKSRSLVPTGRFVWRPCTQSWSQLRPFVELREGEQIRYLDVQGCVHDELTTTGA